MGAQDRWNASTVNRDRLNELLLQSAFRKISEANQGIGNKAQRHIVAMNSGGPVDDGPPYFRTIFKTWFNTSKFN